MSEQIPITPTVLKWARERAGYTVDDISKQYKKIEAWEKGDSFPTYKQLEALSNKYKCPLAVFFFPDPPKLEPINKSFRTLPDFEFRQIPAHLKKILHKAKAMQINLEELNEGVNQSKKLILSDLEIKVGTSFSKVVSEVRSYLGVTLEQQFSWNNFDVAFEAWREVLIDHGIFVFKDSFKTSEFSGFCLFDKEFPIIYINNSNSKTRQIFTLFHELGHLLFGISGVDKENNDYIRHLKGDQKKIEVFCNKFAGDFLVPKSEFTKLINEVSLFDEKNIRKLSDKFKVSREVILRKLLDRNRIDQDYYNKKIEEWKGEAQPPQKGAGGDYYFTQIIYLGKTYTQLALSKFHQNKINAEKLAEYLNIKPKNISKFEDKFLGGRA